MYSTVRRNSLRRATPPGFASNIPVEAEIYIDAGSLAISDLGKLRRGDLIALEEWEESRAYLQCGGVRIPIRRAEVDGPRGSKSPTTFSVEVGSTTEELDLLEGPAVGDLESEQIDQRIAEPVAAMKGQLQEGFEKLFHRIEALGNRQDELADQILLTGEQEPRPRNPGGSPSRQRKIPSTLYIRTTERHFRYYFATSTPSSSR